MVQIFFSASNNALSLRAGHDQEVPTVIAFFAVRLKVIGFAERSGVYVEYARFQVMLLVVRLCVSFSRHSAMRLAIWLNGDT